MRNKRGRDIFAKLEFVFNFIVKILKLFPKAYSLWFYKFCYSKSGNIYIGLRYCILKRLGKNIGKNIYISSNVVIKHFEQLEIGNNVSIHDFSYIDAEGGIKIGNDVSIAHGSSLLSSNHNYDNLEVLIKNQGMNLKKTIIDSNVWIAAGVKIMPGINIKYGSIIGAGAVVTKNTRENSIYGGVPAKFIKKR